jgi:hypothetical protein
MGENDYIPERRPLAARNLGISAAATRWLVRMGVRPNTISIASFSRASAAVSPSMRARTAGISSFF